MFLPKAVGYDMIQRIDHSRYVIRGCSAGSASLNKLQDEQDCDIVTLRPTLNLFIILLLLSNDRDGLQKINLRRLWGGVKNRAEYSVIEVKIKADKSHMQNKTSNQGGKMKSKSKSSGSCPCDAREHPKVLAKPVAHHTPHSQWV
jgi:hypothetical protein